MLKKIFKKKRIANIKIKIWGFLSKKIFLVTREQLLFFSEKIWYYGVDETIIFKEPLQCFNYQVFPLKKQFFEKPFVCSIRDVTLYGKSGLAITASGGLLIEASVLYENTVQAIIDTPFLQMTKKNIPVLGCAFSTITPYSGRFYYHWLMETLPCLQGVKYYIKTTGETPVIIIQKNPPSWVIESLLLCGFGKENLFEYDGNSVNIKKLILPSYQRREMFSTLSSLTWLKNEMSVTAIGKKKKSPYVYISRNDAESRRVSNENELMDYLGHLGFEKFILSELPVIEQIELFRNAKCVIAPHGAGLANILFSECKASIIELFGEHYRPGFYILASMLYLTYISIPCEQRGVDIVADLEKVKIAFDNIEIGSTF